jgi:hypothetical protein
MPFTLAHPAAIMPLRRFRYLPTLALIVGSMVPDVPYFLPSWAGGVLSAIDMHTLYGSIVMGIPVGLVLLAIVLLLQGPLTALLSDRARWVALREAAVFAHPVNWLLAILALLIGSWTHILWDEFTHPGTWVTSHVAALDATVDVFGLYSGAVSHILQYVSSILGLLIIAYWYGRAVAQAPAEVKVAANRPRRRRALLLVTVAAIVIGTLHALRGVHPLPLIYHLAYLLLTRTTAWFMLLYVIAGAIVLRTQRPQPPQTQLES